MPRAISFDFWNTLYADGEEFKRRILRKEYFASIISSYREIEPQEVEQAFEAGSKLFLDNWINHSTTPTAADRIRFMAEYLSVRLSENQVHDAVEFFGQMVFEVSPQEIDFVKEMIPRKYMKDQPENKKKEIINETLLFLSQIRGRTPS